MNGDGPKSRWRGSLLAGLTFASLLTLTVCLLFGELLRTFLSGSDTGYDIAEWVF
jgi:hypothetical protein